MRSERISTEFTGAEPRPAITVEREHGQMIVRLHTGRSGPSDISIKELHQLAEIASEASQFVRDLARPPLATDVIESA